MAKPNDERESANDRQEPAPPPPVSYFTIPVFNLNQCEGMERAEEKTAILPEAQSVIKKYVDRERRLIPGTLSFSERGLRAYYVPSEDRIVIPPRSQYTDAAEYCVTAFHEIAHSTGHPKRLDRRDRNKPSPFGSHEYGQEELVAEMTASLLSAETGLDFGGAWARNAASYLADWLSVIRGDPGHADKGVFPSDRGGRVHTGPRRRPRGSPQTGGQARARTRAQSQSPRGEEGVGRQTAKGGRIWDA